MKNHSFWNSMKEKIRRRKEAEKEVARKGGNVFEQLEARLMDFSTGKLGEDIVIYGIRTINDENRARSFLEGYISDVNTNLQKYPVCAKADPKGYAISDFLVALNMHFYSPKTHKFWNSVIDGLDEKNIKK